MIEALVGLADAVHLVYSLPDLIRAIKSNPEMSIGLVLLMLAGSLVAILIRRTRRENPLTLR
jgi:hypothetical protein